MKCISRFFAEYAIEIRGQSAYCVKGKISRRILGELSALAFEQGIHDGEIWIDKLGRVTCSTEIPEALHQRIRNVLSTA